MARVMCAVAAFMIAAAVVQAAASEVPHVTKKHGEKTTRPRGKSFMKDPSSLLTELEEMAHSGEAPAFDLVSMIKNLILDDILPSLQISRDVAANETTDLQNAIELCNNESTVGAIQIEATIQVSVNNARSLHAACRDTQKSMYYHNLTSAESSCVKLGKFLHEIEPLSIRDGRTQSQAVDYVKSAGINSKMCSLSEVTELDDNCTQKEEELRIKETECSLLQEHFEGTFCALLRQSEVNCQQLSTCHSMAVTNYQNHLNKTAVLLEKWNIETAALQKILCYCNMWLSDIDEGDNRSQHNVTQFEVCKDRTYTPDSWLPAVPCASVEGPSVDCPPGDDCFNQEYSSFVDFVARVVPCI